MAAANPVGPATTAGLLPTWLRRRRNPARSWCTAHAATVVIVQWREARDAMPRTKDALDRFNARERLYQLEIELIEDAQAHAAPGDTYPWDWGDRRQEVRRRNEAAGRPDRGPQDAPAAPLSSPSVCGGSRAPGTAAERSFRIQLRLRCGNTIVAGWPAN